MKKIFSILIVVFLILNIFSACANLAPNSNNADEMLYSYVNGGNSQGVIETIDAGANKERLPYGEHTDHGTFERNPFRIACFLNNQNAAKALIENGANPNAIDAEGYPILSYVARRGSVELCQLLLDHGADVNKAGTNGYTPLDAIFLDIANVRPNDYLINQVFDLFLSKSGKVTPKTIEAIMKGHKEGYRNYLLDQKTLKILLASGQKSGLSPVLEAAMLGKSDQVQAYLKSGQVPKADLQDILFYTAAFGDSKTLQLLAQKGQSLKSTDDLDNTLLAIASKTGNLDTMQFLIENGANLNAQNGDYYSPLRLAVADDQYEAAKLLLSKGAKMQAESLLDNSPDVLWNAAWNGNVNMIKLLFQYGYPKTDAAISLAMQSAAENNQTGPLKYLISLGYNADLEYFDQTPLAQACKYGNVDIIQFLIDHGADPNGRNLKGTPETPLSIACSFGQTDAARYLIEKGADVNFIPQYSKSDFGSTALTGAISSGSLEIVKLLIQHGANINENDPNEGYPLTVAAFFRSKVILEVLLKNGAEVNGKDNDENTALILAARDGDIDNVKLLLQYHADKSIKNKSGETALTVSKSANSAEINQLLQKAK